MTDESMSEVKRDILVSLIFVLLGIFAIITINMGETTKITESATLTHATLPTIYGALLIFLSGIIFVDSLRKLVTGKHGAGPEHVNTVSEELKVEASPRMVILRTWGTLALLVAYAVLLAHLNFIVLTAGFLAMLFVLFGRKKPWKIALASLLGSSGFYLLFIYFLKLPI
jgi:hypothetical protein